MRSMAEKNGVYRSCWAGKVQRQIWSWHGAVSRFGQGFADRGKATEQVAKTAAMRREAMDDYQSGVVGKLIGVNDPTTVQRYIG